MADQRREIVLRLTDHERYVLGDCLSQLAVDYGFRQELLEGIATEVYAAPEPEAASLGDAPGSEAFELVRSLLGVVKSYGPASANVQGLLAPGKTIVSLSGTKAPDSFGFVRPDVVILNYDILPYWLPAIRSLNPALVFIDEIHKAKSADAQRTKHCLTLASWATHGVFGTSGTLVPNRRHELVEPLRIVGWLEELGGEANVLRRPDLAEALRARCMVRRLKTGVMPDLPPRAYVPLATTGDPAAMVEYDLAERKFLDWLKDWALDKAAQEGVAADDLDSYALERVLKARSAEALVKINALRRIAGKAKVPATLEHARMMRDDGRSLLVFSEHVRQPPVLQLLSKGLGAPRIDGDTDEDTATKIEDAFQAGDMPVLCLSRAAAGEGLTLTAAHDAIFCELPWGPGALDQALDRCYGRVNDPHGATGYEVVLERESGGQTIDARILALIEEKREEADDALDRAYDEDQDVEPDKEDGGGGTTKHSVLKDLVWDLAQEQLAGK